MPRFPIDWKIQFSFAFCVENHIISRLMLNDDWAIVCIAYFERTPLRYVLNAIEIHRRNTDAVSSLSGELIIHLGGKLRWKGKFFRFMKSGSSVTDITSNIPDVSFPGEYYWMRGFVNITESNNKCSTDLGNEEAIEKIQLENLEVLSKDFKRLLEPKESCFTDLTLKCGSVSIPAHKNILSARSPIFAGIFAKENSENEVEVNDMDVSTLRDLLTYMYTGKTPNLTVSSAANLLTVANKYELQGLKRVCFGFLKGIISLQNVLKILTSLDKHSEDLKLFALEYICNNCVEFSVLEKTEEWETLQKERPILAMEVLASLVKSKEENSEE